MESAADRYQSTLDALSSLITKKSRADNSNKGDRYDLLFDYLKVIWFCSEWVFFFQKLIF